VTVDIRSSMGERRVRVTPVLHDRRAVRVLVIEHDEGYQASLQAGLEVKGYQVEHAMDALDGLRRFVLDPPDIVLIDVLLPGIPATDVCIRMRGLREVPVIMITAVETTFDPTRALDAGAVDYVARPHRMRELAARIEAVRRLTMVPSQAFTSTAGVDAPRRGVISVDELRVDRDARKVTMAGEVIHLPRREFDLLVLLLSPPGRLWSRAELVDRLWSERHCPGSRTLDTHIRRLRQKLERAPGRERRLVTVRGVGFRYDADCLDDEGSAMASGSPRAS